MKALVIQSCLPLCDPMDSSPPGSSVHGILQARILEWVAMPFSRGSSWCRDRTPASHIAGRYFTIWATWLPYSSSHGGISSLSFLGSSLDLTHWYTLFCWLRWPNRLCFHPTSERTLCSHLCSFSYEILRCLRTQAQTFCFPQEQGLQVIPSAFRTLHKT